MEEYHNCPICFEVPEKEIYQCSSGHVICNVCIVSLTQCPQCRVSYGASRVRCRVLETYLDILEFECKFKNIGCRNMCKRNEILCHTTTCSFNPDLTPLCALLRWENCDFKLGLCSRVDIIKRFTEVHKCDHRYAPEFSLEMKQCRKELAMLIATTKGKTVHSTHLRSLSTAETSDLFMINYKINKTTQCLSTICVQLWGSEPLGKYKIEYSFHSIPVASDSSSCSALASSTLKLEPFLMSWTLNVYTAKEAEYMLKTYQISLLIPVTDANMNGGNSDDVLHGRISQIT